MQGLELARSLYFDEGAAMIKEKFPEYESRIAVGLAGRGSQCFGFDDELSRDHDFEKGFCLWLTDEDDSAIGLELSRQVRALFGKPEGEASALGFSGVGVMRISDFYRPYTATGKAPETWQEWLYLPSHALAEATNGEVFRDDLGEFSDVREAIKYGMPEDVRRKKLAARLVLMAQSGQYNYSRCLHHGEAGAAVLALGEFVKNSAEAVYLLNRSHAPYYKWLLRGMCELPKLAQLAEALEFLLTSENDSAGQKLKAAVIEDICAETVKELKAQDLSHASSDYLEQHAFDVQSHIENAQLRALHIMEG